MIYHIPQDLIEHGQSWGDWVSTDGSVVDSARSDSLAWSIFTIVFRAIASAQGYTATIDLVEGDIETDATQEQVLFWFDVALEYVWDAVEEGTIPAMPPFQGYSP